MPLSRLAALWNRPVQRFIARVAVEIGPRNGTRGRLGEAEADLPVQQPVQ